MRPLRLPRRTAVGLLAALVLPLLPGLPAAAQSSSPDGEVVVARTAPPQAGEQTVVARVEQVVQEREADAPEQETTVLATAEGRAEVASDVLADVPSGSTLEVTVAPAPDGEVRVLAAETTDAQVPAAAGTPTVAPATHVATPTVTTSDPRRHDVYVVMQAPVGTTPDAATATVRTAVERAADFWTAETGGAVTMNVVQVVGWNTTATVDCSNTFAVWNEAEKRSAFRPGRSTHLLVYTPRASSCAYGVGTVGGDPHAGGVSSVRALDQSLIAHELGHNLSLGHSGSLTCSTSDARWAAPLPAGCGVDDYGDYADVMGASGDPVGLGSVNVLHLLRLGAVGAVPVLTAAPATRTVVLDALSAGPGAARAVQVVDPRGDVLWLEHRSRTGRDLASAAVRGLTFGVRVLKRHPRAGGASVVLDGTPTGAWELDRVLRPGVPLRSASGWATVTVESATAATASVSVRIADPTPVVPTASPKPSPTTPPTSPPTPAPTLSPTPLVAPSPTVAPPPVVVAPPAPPAPAPPVPAPPAPAPPAPAPLDPAPAPQAPAPLAPAPQAPPLAPVVAEPVGPPTAQPAPSSRPTPSPAPTAEAAAPAAGTAPTAPAPVLGPPVPAPAPEGDVAEAAGSRPVAARAGLDAPDRTAVGSVYTVRGTVRDAAGTPVADAPVQLLHQSAGSSAWRRIRTARTDSRGAVAFPVRAVTGASYRLLTGEVASPVERVQVTSALSLAGVPRSARAGRSVVVSGRTTAGAGTVVVAEVTSGRRVVRRVAAAVRPDGRLTARLVLPRGTYGVRLARRSTPALLGTTTPSSTLRVR